MSATQPPADAVEAVARAIALEFDVDPDVFIGMHGRGKWEKQWHPPARAAIAAFEATLRPAIIRQCAAYLDSYAGGHYMAQSCADALRELAQREEPSRG